MLKVKVSWPDGQCDTGTVTVLHLHRSLVGAFASITNACGHSNKYHQGLKIKDLFENVGFNTYLPLSYCYFQSFL